VVRIRTLAAVAVLASGATAGAAERDHQRTFYYYDNERIELEIVADELSVGKSSAEELFNRATLEVGAITVEVRASRLGSSMWRLRLDPQASPAHRAFSISISRTACLLARGGTEFDRESGPAS